MAFLDSRLRNEMAQEGSWKFLLGGVVGLLIGRFLIRAVYNVLFHPLKGVPGPWLARVWGHYLTLAQINRRRSQTIRNLHNRYGPIIRVAPNEISISDWTVYREIYNNKNTTKTKEFYDVAKLSGFHNIFTMQDKQHHASRRKLQNQSHSLQAITQVEPEIVERADVLLKRILHQGKTSDTGRTADVYLLDGLYTLEVILKCAFDRSYGESLQGDSMTMLRGMEGAAVAIQIVAAFPLITRTVGIHLPKGLGDFFRKWDVWESMVTALVEDFQQHTVPLDTNQKFMATPLLLNEDTFVGRRLTQAEVREEVMAIIFAGSGTTSTTLTYLLYALARDSTLQTRLRDELQTVGNSWKELQTVPLLTAIIKETFRLYPALLGYLPRVLDHDIAFGKHLLPKGTLVGMQNYVHHRDAYLFPNPDAFIPDRWLAADSETKNMNSALTPFSVGQRNCLGQNLSKAELYIATSKIVRKFKFKLNSRMAESDMDLEDLVVGLPKGKRLLLDFETFD